MPNVQVSKNFLKEFEELIQYRFSLKDKILQLRDDLQDIGFSPLLFSKYDIKQLKIGYWRIKFIPYRVIIRLDLETNTIFLEKIFKRKGKSDYKKYNK